MARRWVGSKPCGALTRGGEAVGKRAQALLLQRFWLRSLPYLTGIAWVDGWDALALLHGRTS
jgi:hypothetical protein